MRAQLWPSTVNIYMEAHNIAFYSLKPHKAWKTGFCRIAEMSEMFSSSRLVVGGGSKYCCCSATYYLAPWFCINPSITTSYSYMHSGPEESLNVSVPIVPCWWINHSDNLFIIHSHKKLQHLIPLVPPSISFGSALHSETDVQPEFDRAACASLSLCSYVRLVVWGGEGGGAHRSTW